jgi:hypothetical protein
MDDMRPRLTDSRTDLTCRAGTASARRRLTGEMAIWLTTAGRDGTPQPNPAGFGWDAGDSLR